MLVCALGDRAKQWLVHIARALDTGFAGHPNALLFFVMILCPLVMNLVQVSHAGTSERMACILVMQDSQELLPSAGAADGRYPQAEAESSEPSRGDGTAWGF